MQIFLERNRNIVACLGFLFASVSSLFAIHSLAAGPSGKVENGNHLKAFGIEQGYLFIDSVYIAPPYKIEAFEDSIAINGVPYGATDFGIEESETPDDGIERFRRPDRGSEGGFRRERRGHSPLHRIYRDVDSVQMGAIVVIESGCNPMVLWPEQQGGEFLALTSVPKAKRSTTPQLPPTIKGTEHAEVYRNFFATFEVTPSFEKRMVEDMSRLEAAEMRSARELAIKHWVDFTVYPLTMFALMLVVFAVGHLMANAQSVFNQDGSSGLDIDPQVMKRNIVRSLLIVAGLSIIDLVWTLMAHQTGSMRELNPIGSRLISNPTLLVLFKTTVTGMSIGLLYWLRTQPLARKATWWCCLILTLLTARWLTFHSLLA